MISSSWGLVLDLGDEISEATAKDLFQSFWDSPAFETPDFTMGSFFSVPQAAEGKLTVADQRGKTYTKFEQDSIGYPPGWQVPTTFSLSVFGFTENLPENQVLQEFLLKQARLIAEQIPYRMAVIGDLGAYYLNADMLNTDWFDLQQQAVLSLILTAEHPFTRQQRGQKFVGNLFLYTQNELKQYWTGDDAQTRFLRYKTRMAESLHSEKQALEWEI